LRTISIQNIHINFEAFKLVDRPISPEFVTLSLLVEAAIRDEVSYCCWDGDRLGPAAATVRCQITRLYSTLKQTS